MNRVISIGFPDHKQRWGIGPAVPLVLIVASVLMTGFRWSDLWFSPDQQGQRLSDRQQYQAAAEAYRDPLRKGAAWFRAGEFEKSASAFARSATPQAEFNRGNALVMLGKYEDAVQRYDRALELQPGWEDAIVNREVASIRAERVKQEGGEMGDQEIGADEIRFDKKKGNEGQETEFSDDKVVSSQEMQAMWLRRVQTSPADFLKSKFSYQLQMDNEGNGESGSKGRSDGQ